MIPRTLSENAGLKAEQIIAEMYAGAEKSPHWGVDVSDGKVKDCNEA